ncbi:gag-pol polyprotein, partial [Pseudoloma neurophilia]
LEILEENDMLKKKKRRLTIGIKSEIQSIDPKKSNICKPCCWNKAEREMIDQEVEKLLVEGKIVESNSKFLSPVVIVGKSDSSKRFSIDYRKLNMNTVRKQFPIPDTDDLLSEIGDSPILSKIDLESAYHQIKMSKNDQEKPGFITHGGCYEWTVMPFGLVPADKISKWDSIWSQEPYLIVEVKRKRCYIIRNLPGSTYKVNRKGLQPISTDENSELVGEVNVIGG